mmetsp:Transcript_1353/g.2967  ORF Transcript_1353/g.2967 Transcript_1353/m.2967 type:complete len:217 (+) Transcript_1353:757-1407(+)
MIYLWLSLCPPGAVLSTPAAAQHLQPWPELQQTSSHSPAIMSKVLSSASLRIRASWSSLFHRGRGLWTLSFEDSHFIVILRTTCSDPTIRSPVLSTILSDPSDCSSSRVTVARLTRDLPPSPIDDAGLYSISSPVSIMLLKTSKSRPAGNGVSSLGAILPVGAMSVNIDSFSSYSPCETPCETPLGAENPKSPKPSVAPNPSKVSSKGGSAPPSTR